MFDHFSWSSELRNHFLFFFVRKMIISSGWRACANTIKSGTDTDAHLTSALTNFAPATIVVSRELGQADKIVDHI